MRQAHGSRNLLDVLTLTNVCLFCGSIFASRENARYHSQRALRYGRCLVSRSPYGGGVVQPRELQCPACNLEFQHLADLQEHLKIHWPGPFPPSVASRAQR